MLEIRSFASVSYTYFYQNNGNNAVLISKKVKQKKETMQLYRVIKDNYSH